MSEYLPSNTLPGLNGVVIWTPCPLKVLRTFERFEIRMHEHHGWVASCTYNCVVFGVEITKGLEISLMRWVHGDAKSTVPMLRALGNAVHLATLSLILSLRAFSTKMGTV